MSTHKVLIVEDDDAFLPLIQLALRDFDFDIDVANSGQAALLKISETQYELVISDYRLPEVHGLDILKAAMARNEECKAVLISAADTDMMTSELENINLLGFLQKPLSPLELRRLISVAFELREQVIQSSF